MPQSAIPYLFLRGGSSRGPYFRRSDLPEDLDRLSEILIAVVGAGHPRTIDGIGGGVAVTTKVAMLSKSERPDADVDYFFAQVGVEQRQVDYKPTCGNILTGVGPAALEMGLIPAEDGETRVRIHAVNTGATVEAVVQTPGGVVEYEGAEAIDGVPGTAAPVGLNFLDVVGSATSGLLPTGNLIDVQDGVAFTCMDVAMPMVIARASDFGLSGYETVEELDANRDFYARIEPMRVALGAKMGLGEVTKSVVPKIGLIAPPRNGGTVTVRYFMPWEAHPTMAVTGGQCVASCALTPGTVADGIAERPEGNPAPVRLEHPMGHMDVTVDYRMTDGRFELRSAGLVRTARLIARGEVMVPSHLLA